LLVSVHSTGFGGAERLALLEAERLAADYGLVIAAPVGPLRERFERHGLLVAGPPLLPTWGAPAWRWGVQLARTLIDTGRLMRVIRRHRVAGVVCNSAVALSPVVAAWVMRRPAVVHIRDWPASRLTRPLFRLHATLATTVIPISMGVEEMCGPRPRARIARISDGIEIPRSPPSRAPFRRPLHLGVVGAIDPRKGQDVAVRALREVRSRGVDAELHLVGREQDPAFAATVRDLAAAEGVEAAVRLHGERSDVESIYQELDVLLVPSRGEWTPLVIMEALARDLPVVAARVGSVPELVLHGETGLLVEPDNPAEVATAVETLVQQPDLARALARRGRAHVSAGYDLEATLAGARREVARAVTLGRRGSVAAHE
jgi:glycosyltransferase involved in cell wall biosynthesis